jgi:hypothetical protein
MDAISESVRFRISFSFGNLCYTESMHEDDAFWPAWAQFLHKKGVTDIIASLLEGAAPLRIIASQLIHASTPFIGSSSATGRQWRALAGLLEDPERTALFISYLRGETQR